MCHSEERSDEDELLRTLSEKSRKHKVDVPEILRFALDDITGYNNLIKKYEKNTLFYFLGGSLVGLPRPVCTDGGGSEVRMAGESVGH